MSAIDLSQDHLLNLQVARIALVATESVVSKSNDYIQISKALNFEYATNCESNKPHIFRQKHYNC